MHEPERGQQVYHAPVFLEGEAHPTSKPAIEGTRLGREWGLGQPGRPEKTSPVE